MHVYVYTESMKHAKMKIVKYKYRNFTKQTKFAQFNFITLSMSYESGI